MPAKKKPNPFYTSLSKPLAAPQPAPAQPAPVKPAAASKPPAQAERATAKAKHAAPAAASRPSAQKAVGSAVDNKKASSDPKKPGRKRVVDPSWVAVHVRMEPVLRDRLNMICRLKKTTVQEALVELIGAHVDENMDFLRANI